MNLIRSLVFLTALLTGTTAEALTRAQIPTKMGTVWGQSAGSSYIRVIPVPSQIGIQNCAASFTDGFPPLTFVPPGSGGCGPFGQDMNGILNIITLWLQWAQGGGPMPFDSTFQTSIGGYPRDALVQSNILHGRIWYSTADNNTTNPDDQTGAAINWVAQPGTNPAGTLVPSLSATPPLNSVAANGLTVGNASSNATGLASSTTYWLFVYIWNSCATCNLFNSSGGLIARGSTGAADWNANNAIATPDLRGSTVVGADATGLGGTSAKLNNVPVTTGSRTTGASVVGENLHTQLTAELAQHTHTYTEPNSGQGHQHFLPNTATTNQGSGALTNFIGTFAGTSNTTSFSTTGITINNTGSSTPFNDVQLSVTVFWNLAL